MSKLQLRRHINTQMVNSEWTPGRLMSINTELGLRLRWPGTAGGLPKNCWSRGSLELTESVSDPADDFALSLWFYVFPHCVFELLLLHLQLKSLLWLNAVIKGVSTDFCPCNVNKEPMNYDTCGKLWLEFCNKKFNIVEILHLCAKTFIFSKFSKLIYCSGI